MKHQDLAVAALLASLASPAFADIWECIDENGVKRFTNIKSEAKGCRLLQVAIPNTVPGTRPPTRALGEPPRNFPKVDGDTQRSRDAERRRILEQELASEQKLLDQARNELAAQESMRLGSERNYQRMLDRLEPYKKKVKLHEDNVANLRRELAAALPGRRTIQARFLLGTGTRSSDMIPAAFSGLDPLATAVVLVDAGLAVRYMNPAAENLFEMSSRNVAGQPLAELFTDTRLLMAAIGHARATSASYTEHELELGVNGRGRLHLSCTVTPVELNAGAAADTELLLEFRHIAQQLRIAREERLHEQSQATRELIRNLAHEIKNPLGGIRGAAQLLDRELERPNLHEYTQVIMKEADRLQSLLDRLLTPHRLPQPGRLNLHEVLERVRSLIQAEFPRGVVIDRDYDVSLPPITGDKEQLIQAMLNIVRNAAQAIAGGGSGKGTILLRTRVVRQVTVARRRYRHALAVDVTDDGPGIPDELQERVFHPLVSGREGGSGLGLTLAQTFISQHHGFISFESAPGNTTFTILLPVEEIENGKS